MLDALLQRDVRSAAAARPAGPRVAAAGRVELAGRGPTTRSLPFASGGESLVPVTPWDVGWGGVWDRTAAVSLPTIKRARDLICTAVGALPITAWSIDFNRVPAVEQQTAPAGWMQRPDPNVTRQYLLAWTADDLMFYGLSHWVITGRYADSYPSSFTRALPGDVQFDERTDRVTVRGHEVDPADIVEFLSPVDSLLSVGFRPISIALQLDDAAERFAGTEVPAGWLAEREGSEDQSSDELAAQARLWTQARRENTTAALNKYFDYHEASYDASKMQLVEGRTYQALELARLGNVPPYLVGAPAGTGMTYLNGEQARQDLIDFGALPYIGCIEQTLSGPNVTPRGSFVRLDLDAWLRNPFTTTAGTAPKAEPSPNDMQTAFNPKGTP
jgi:hypothetical protein